MKVLLITDNPSLPSGLARVGREIASALYEKYNLTYLGLHIPTTPDAEVPYKITTCGEGYGKSFLSNSNFDIVITIGDPFHFDYIPSLQNRKNFTWINYVTIDSINYIGRLPLEWQLPLYNPDFLITTSDFGRSAIMSFLEINPAVFPLGVGSEFHQVSDEERKELRQKSGTGNSFVIISINRNCIRKQFSTLLKVAQRLSKTKVEDFHGFKFIIHTNASDDYGYNLNNLIRNYELSNVFFTQTLHNDIELNNIYNTGDCFLTTSGGEGFGLTILEAMKCGLPIIGANYSSIPELVNIKRPSGILINPIGYLTTEEGTELALLNPEEIASKIEHLARNPKERLKYSKQAQENASKYLWKEMREGIVEILENIERKETRRHVGDEKIKEPVDLVILKGTNWQSSTYAKINQIFQLDDWNSARINDALKCSEADWVALIGNGVQVQRGWLCELLKSATDETAVVVSTCINSKGVMVDGEIRCGSNLLFFPEDGLPPCKHDKEISYTVFSCVLINQEIWEKLDGFKENLVRSYFDIEYCLRCQSEGYKVVKSAKSIVLKTQSAELDEKDGHQFKLETETKLNTPVFVQYQGTRQKIKTIYGDLGKEPVKFPFRTALDMVHLYKHISFVDVQKDCHILDYLIESGGRALIARNMGLGDVLSALYFAARPLKVANPNIHLAVCVNKPYANIVKWLPFVDEVFLYPEGLSMAKDFDFFKDLSYIPESQDPKSQLPRPDVFAKAALERQYFNFDYETFQVPDEYAMKAQIEFEKSGIHKDGRKVIGIQATCESPIRVYAPEYLSELVKLLTKDFDVLLFGLDKHWRWGLENWNGRRLWSFVNKVDDLEATAALMEKCDYAIAPDSGLMHLWAFMKKPVLCLFGNIKPENRLKYYPTATPLYPEGEIDCIPCGDVHNPCPECSDLGTKGTFSGMCMRRLYPERVYLKFLEMIGMEQRGRINSETKVLQCPLCGTNEQIEVINRIAFWDNAQIPECVFARCRNDGLVFVIGDSESIVYEKEYFQSKTQKYYNDILSKEETDRQTRNARRVLDEFYK